MLLWLLVAVALAFVISGVTMWFIARLARRRLPEAMEAASRGGTDTLRVAPMTQFYGVVSAGRGQLRGDGVLILTADELRFDMWSPERRLVIPLAAVLHVDTTKRHAGRYSVKPLLRVTWRDAHGLEDAAAWALTERDEWAQALDDAVRAARTAGGDSLPQAERADRRLDHEEGR
jgi:hypothetical protein